MANHPSALKRAKQAEKRSQRNKSILSATKSAVKKALEAIKSSSSIDDARKALIAGERALQKAATKGTIPKSRASRKTSRLAAAIQSKFSS